MAPNLGGIGGWTTEGFAVCSSNTMDIALCLRTELENNLVVIRGWVSAGVSSLYGKTSDTLIGGEGGYNSNNGNFLKMKTRTTMETWLNETAQQGPWYGATLNCKENNETVEVEQAATNPSPKIVVNGWQCCGTCELRCK